MLVISLGTSKRVGKDSLAEHLIKMRGRTQSILGRYDDSEEGLLKPHIVRMAFADAVKEEVNEAIVDMMPMIENFKDAQPVLLGFWTSFCRQHKIHLTSPVEVDFTDPLCPLGKCRQALQWWGTDLRRRQDPDYWVRKMITKLNACEANIVIITDMRFPNEWGMTRNLREASGGRIVGKTWKLLRVYPKGQEPPADNHASETALDGYVFDDIIMSSSLEVLYEKGRAKFDALVNEYPHLV